MLQSSSLWLEMQRSKINPKLSKILDFSRPSDETKRNNPPPCRRGRRNGSPPSPFQMPSNPYKNFCWPGPPKISLWQSDAQVPLPIITGDLDKSTIKRPSYYPETMFALIKSAHETNQGDILNLPTKLWQNMILEKGVTHTTDEVHGEPTLIPTPQEEQ